MLKNQITWKITWKQGVKLRETDDTFCIECSSVSIICQKRTSESEKYTQYTRLKMNAYYETFNTFLRRNPAHLDWKDTLLVVEVPTWVSPLCLVQEKKQFGILVFLEVHEINFLEPLKVNTNTVYFYMNFFHFTKKFLPLLTMQAFLWNILPQHTASTQKQPPEVFCGKRCS